MIPQNEKLSIKIDNNILKEKGSPREFPGGKSKKKKVWASIKPLQQLPFLFTIWIQK